MKRIRDIKNNSFYCELPWWCKVSSLFIRGDLFVLLPLLIAIIGIGFFSVPSMLIVLGIYIAVRELGEMIYWLLQQFGDRKYRPYDWGFRNLDNNAIYILYQTFALAGTVMGISVVFFAILYW
mgnify:CR=1 FL=1